MTENDLKALDKAGREAAAETLKAFAAMVECEVPVDVVHEDEAISSNSLDKDFFQSLIDGAHLNEKFLQNAF